MKKLESVGRVSLLRSHTGKSLCQDSGSDLCDCVFYRSGLCLFSESDLSSDWSDRALHPPAVLWHRGGSVTTPLQRHGMNISFRDYRHALLPGASWESCALSGWLASYWIRPSLDFSVGWPMLSFQLGRGDNPPWQSLANMCKSAYQASGSPQLTKTENIHWQKSGHFLRLPCRECPEDLVRSSCYCWSYECVQVLCRWWCSKEGGSCQEASALTHRCFRIPRTSQPPLEYD